MIQRHAPDDRMQKEHSIAFLAPGRKVSDLLTSHAARRRAIFSILLNRSSEKVDSGFISIFFLAGHLSSVLMSLFSRIIHRSIRNPCGLLSDLDTLRR